MNAAPKLSSDVPLSPVASALALGDMDADPKAGRRASRANANDLHWLQAFAQLRRGDWPERLAELEPQSLRFKLVRLRAVLIARGIVAGSGSMRAEPGAPLVRTRMHPTGRPSIVANFAGPMLDRKRLAAGERDGD